MNKLIFFLITLLFINSCGNTDDNNWVTVNNWGYNSNYSGNAAYASLKTLP